MPSSTSSSETVGRRAGGAGGLFWAWGAAVLLASLALAGIDVHWRKIGFEPEISDSKQLWSVQRDAVYGSDPLPVVFIGASRSAYGMDIGQWKSRFPGTHPVMLSVNGHHPMALLRDLAVDPAFRGLVICDVNVEGLTRKYRDMQQPWVSYYHEQWTPNWRIHRYLLGFWQETSVLGDPNLGWKPSLQRWLDGVKPTLPVAKIEENRSGYIRFDRIPDLASYGQWFEKDAVKKMEAPILSPEDFLAGVSDVVDWVHAIQSRGGQVVFFQPPVAGKLLDLEFAYYNREQYWDVFAKLPGVHAISGMDLSVLREFELPDLSHVGPGDRATMTQALEDELLRMGLMDHSGRLIQESALELQGQGVAPDQPFHLPKPVREGDVAPGRIQ